jgi:hypothetical protein
MLLECKLPVSGIRWYWHKESSWLDGKIGQYPLEIAGVLIDWSRPISKDEHRVAGKIVAYVDNAESRKEKNNERPRYL